MCKTRQPFLIQQVKNPASVQVIAKTPANLESIELSLISASKLSVVSFGRTIELKIFHSTAKCCNDATDKVDSITVKDLLLVLLMDLNSLNSKSTMRSRKKIEILNSFISTRFPSNRTDLKPGIHWHWKSFASNFPKLGALVGL